MSAPPQDTAAPASAGAAEAPHRGAAVGVLSGGGRRRRRLIAAALLALAAAAVAAALLASSSAPRSAAATGVPAGDTTTAVTRRTLTESSTVDGTLGYGDTMEIYDRIGGTFTWLPAVGATIGRGGTLFRIDNLPIVLMYGSLPAYRALAEGVGDGADVAELNANLIALGYDPEGAIGERERYGAATAAAVRRWQHAEGLPETGKVELGRVVFAPGARRVTAVHVTLGQDPPGEGTPTTPSAPASTTPAPASTTPAPASTTPAPAATTPASPPKKARTPAAKAKPRPAKPRASAAPAAAAPAAQKPAGGSETPSKTPEGGKGGAGELALSTTSTAQLVHVKLKPEQQQLAHVGERAPVTLPGGTIAHARVTEVGTVASEAKEGGSGGGSANPSEGNGESATITATLALESHVSGLDQAPVSVELVKAVRHDVLTVPATALSATAGGGYAIEVLEGARRSALAVTPGMFAGGYVEIEGPGLREGMTVLEAQ